MPDPTPKLPPALQQRSDAATVQEAEAKARKAVAEASDAEQTSVLNRLKTSIGEPAAGPFTGDVTLADGAALAEANFLARAQLQAVATTIASNVKVAIADADRKTLYLTAADGPPDLSHDESLSFRTGLVKHTADEALRLSDKALGTGVQTRAMIAAPLAAAGLALSGLSALSNYFKTDFTIGGNAVTVSDRDLLVLVGGALTREVDNVLIDGFPPAPGKAFIEAAQTELLDLATKITTVRGRIGAHDAQLSALDTAAPAQPVADTDTVDQQQGQLKEAAPVDDKGLAQTQHAQAKTACTAAVTLFDSLVSSLDADAGGISFLERALRERRLRESLSEKAALVSLKIDGSWATHVVRKNFLAGLFGKLPIRLSATVGASWAAYDMESGSLLGGGIETGRSALSDIADIKAG